MQCQSSSRTCITIHVRAVTTSVNTKLLVECGMYIRFTRGQRFTSWLCRYCHAQYQVQSLHGDLIGDFFFHFSSKFSSS